ncbi:hypothetical protein [Paraburkholderia aspalathi]|uniref:hypothetical protein n=1 Tax=Paraburkholderia aspalathi TaxID=1324617 RepID=UPI001FC9E476|nr:hypothetical protein [Paraburkholderia aspalathi]
MFRPSAQAGFDRLLKIEPMVFADFRVLAVAHRVDIAQNVVVTFAERDRDRDARSWVARALQIAPPLEQQTSRKGSIILMPPFTATLTKRRGSLVTPFAVQRDGNLAKRQVRLPVLRIGVGGVAKIGDTPFARLFARKAHGEEHKAVFGHAAKGARFACSSTYFAGAKLRRLKSLGHSSRSNTCSTSV